MKTLLLAIALLTAGCSLEVGSVEPGADAGEPPTSTQYHAGFSVTRQLEGDCSLKPTVVTVTTEGLDLFDRTVPLASDSERETWFVPKSGYDAIHILWHNARKSGSGTWDTDLCSYRFELAAMR